MREKWKKKRSRRLRRKRRKMRARSSMHTFLAHHNRMLISSVNCRVNVSSSVTAQRIVWIASFTTIEKKKRMGWSHFVMTTTSLLAFSRDCRVAYVHPPCVPLQGAFKSLSHFGKVLVGVMGLFMETFSWFLTKWSTNYFWITNWLAEFLHCWAMRFDRLINFLRSEVD